jgi:hypothetical protein
MRVTGPARRASGCLPPDGLALAGDASGTRLGMELRRSPSPPLALLACLAAAVGAGCADDDEPRAAIADEPTAYMSRSEVERLLERELEVVEGGGAVRRAANVVAAFPERRRDVDAYRVADEVLARLGRACGEPGDPELGELCFGVADVILPGADPRTPGPDDPGPAGEGTQPTDFLEAGSTATVGGLRYTPLMARQLDPGGEPDQAILEGVDVDRSGGPLLVAVMLRVCNVSDRPRTPAGDLILKDAFGNHLEPVELPADNELAYRPEELAPDACLPADGSAAEATLGGGALVFRMPLEIRRNPPLGLQISSGAGERQTVAIDL